MSLPDKNKTVIGDIPLFSAFVSVIHLQFVSYCYVVVGICKHLREERFEIVVLNCLKI